MIGDSRAWMDWRAVLCHFARDKTLETRSLHLQRLSVSDEGLWVFISFPLGGIIVEENRRTFLWKSGAWGTVLAASRWPAQSHGFLANESINIGIIGYGGRCRALVKELSRIPGTRITAVCDVFDPNLNAAHALTDKKGFATKDHRALLDRSDVDAVIVATPDHWHVPITVDACSAGKDVYVEKPLTHDLKEGEAVIKAEQSKKRIVQVGMQQRSMPHLQEAYEIIRSGELGHVLKCISHGIAIIRGGRRTFRLTNGSSIGLDSWGMLRRRNLIPFE